VNVGVWRLAFGVWRLAFGVWRLAFGVGTKCQVQPQCFAVSLLIRKFTLRLISVRRPFKPGH
jgi:hypothetical protein